MRDSILRLAAGLSLFLVAGLPQTASAQRDPEITVGKSLQVLSEITRNPKTGMPRNVMRNAQGIAIIPEMFKMSFIFGARFGRGVLVVKYPDGTWSNPMFVNLAGGSFGFQAGAQSTDLVLVFQSQKGLDRFIKGKGKFTLGVDAGVAAGPAGKRFEASTDVGLKSEILSYSNSQGIFAGVSAEGGTLQIDHKANALYYNQATSPGAILAINSALAAPESSISLKQMLAEKTASPERIVKAKKPRGEPVITDDETSLFGEDDGVEVEGAIRTQPMPPSSSRSRGNTRPSQPRVESDAADDLDAIPPPTSRKKPAQPARPQRSNDEDLPEAIPPSARPAKPSEATRPSSVDDDDDLELTPPRTASARKPSR